MLSVVVDTLRFVGLVPLLYLYIFSYNICMRWFKIKGEAEVQFSVEVLTCNILKIKKKIKRKCMRFYKGTRPGQWMCNLKYSIRELRGNLRIIVRFSGLSTIGDYLII